ncbi:MAG TPA: helix-turn-helix domain-containing protein, partial [Chitinophagaceae bacterium]|nr:helix-turn-helix domain-containing protein [Chitinophagaceae bacterium]
MKKRSNVRKYRLCKVYFTTPGCALQPKVAATQPAVAVSLPASGRHGYTFALSLKRDTIFMETKMIGGKIALARKKVNLSQAQLAAQLFISPQAVGKWERGESVPDILTINRIAGILDVDLNYFSEHTLQPGTIMDKNTMGESTAPDTDRTLTNFSGSDLAYSDFAGVKAHKRKFYGSALQEADFSDADLSGSTFTGCD